MHAHPSPRAAGIVALLVVLLAAPQIDQETVYYSGLIVPMESEALDMQDLARRRFAITDLISTIRS